MCKSTETARSMASARSSATATNAQRMMNNNNKKAAKRSARGDVSIGKSATRGSAGTPESLLRDLMATPRSFVGLRATSRIPDVVQADHEPFGEARPLAVSGAVAAAVLPAAASGSVSPVASVRPSNRAPCSSYKQNSK